MAISQVITLLPTAPSRADPDNFATEADAFVAGMEDMPPELNTWATQANSTATSCNTNETNSASNVTYSAEWANKAEDSLVSAAAGGDEVDDYSAKHFAIKSSYEVNYASEWANKAEDSLISSAAGGDQVDDYSALHWANKAQASASAAVAGATTNATSSTSLTIGNAAQSLTIETGKDIVAGMFVTIARTSDPATRMLGVVTSYTTGTGALNVTTTSSYGTGTYTDWTVSLSVAVDMSLDQSWTGHQTFKELSETVYSLSGTTPAIDPANGTLQSWTLTANSTPSESLTDGQFVTLEIDDGTDYTIDWATSMTVEWKTTGGTTPALNASTKTIIQLFKIGSTLYGARVGDA